MTPCFKRFQSTKPLYVTTPIFYVNAAPHIGHLYSMLIADTRCKWEKLDPKKSSYMLTGTDEHGLKIQVAAAKQGIDPKQLVDKVSGNFKDLCANSDVTYDRFIRTTDDDHIKVTKYFWKLMEEKGYIYKGSHSGWYCVSDETFYPETAIEEVERDGKIIKISTETKNEVVFEEETNYFFKLSAFQDQLIQFLKENPNWIKPKHRYDFIMNELLNSPLEDLSISRPANRLNWSIAVPNDESQKIYVWFDALLNYLTATGFPKQFQSDGVTKVGTCNNSGGSSNNENNKNNENNENISSQSFQTPPLNIWPATHIIGKDIIRFHCIYWPIFLIAAGIELPKEVIVHSHWLSDGVKMSKSLGNVIKPKDILDYYGIDPVRFFFMENSNISDDCKYSDELIHQSRGLLINKYCNLINRISSTRFDIRGGVEMYHQRKFEDIDEFVKQEAGNEVAAEIQSLISNLNQLYSVMNDEIKEYRYNRAIQAWWSAINQANQIFQLSHPWSYVSAIADEQTPQETRESYQKLINYYTFICSECVRIASILIQPVMHELSGIILDRMNVDKTKRTSEFARFGADDQYGQQANSGKFKLPLQKIDIRIAPEQK